MHFFNHRRTLLSAHYCLREGLYALQFGRHLHTNWCTTRSHHRKGFGCGSGQFPARRWHISTHLRHIHQRTLHGPETAGARRARLVDVVTGARMSLREVAAANRGTWPHRVQSCKCNRLQPLIMSMLRLRSRFCRIVSFYLFIYLFILTLLFHRRTALQRPGR